MSDARGQNTWPLISDLWHLTSEVVQKALDIIELKLRPECFTKATPQFLQYAPSALHVDLARHFHRRVIPIIAAAQRTPERVGILLGSGRAKPARPAVRAWTEH